MTVEIYSTDILDKEAFWRDQLMQVGKTFLFGCATGFYSNWLDPSGEGRTTERQGIFEGHAYSIMDAKEIKKDGKLYRLLKVRNPWGRKEWDGRWADGSAEWDAEWLTLLAHKFGNDGVFWISYEDLLKKYQHFDRTRIFGPEWSVGQCWTSVDVAWAEEYHSTKFQIILREKAKVVIVLSQLDDNYFKGLEGMHKFELQFRLEDANMEDPDDYIVRANENYAMTRSVSTDIELEAGTYIVLMKITATKDPGQTTVEETLPGYAQHKREKLLQMGLSYDLAHAKGVYVESREEKIERKAKARAERKEERRKIRKEFRKDAEKRWKKDKKRHERAVEKKKRRAERRKATDATGDVDELAKPREGSELLDGQNEGTSKGTGLETQHPKLNGKAEQEIPVRIKSSSGETFEMSGAILAEAEQCADAPRSNDANVDNLMLPLEEVIKISEEETKGNHDHAPTEDATDETAPMEQGSKMPPTPIVKVNGQKVVTDVQPLRKRPPKSTPEVIHAESLPPSRTNTVDTTAAQGSLTNGTTSGSRESGEDRGDADSDDSFESFEWDSELDLPSMYASSSSSDSESESSLDDSNLILYRPPSHPRPSKRSKPSNAGDGIPQPHPPPGEEKQDESAGPDEPWNAVCVVGLRVYSTIEGGVELKVIWPQEEEVTKGNSKKTKLKADEVESKLDPDDPAKGAVNAVMEGAKVE